ncbi:MAG TPA: NYN domain-containing protein [Verrucomicrobiae bacterium]|nr:NYN domain-containing protein [Verrucomicrobiae bacterium]
MTDQKRAIWIVDAAYLLKASPGKFDYLKLKVLLAGENGGEFTEAYYFNSTPNPPTDGQDAFHTWLKFAPPKGPKMRVQLYKLKNVSTRCSSCGKTDIREVQKGVDVGIATLILKLAARNQYERLVLSAGDGDFEDAIDYVKSGQQKEIWIAGFQNSVSADLQSYADRVVFLDDHWQEIAKDHTGAAGD